MLKPRPEKSVAEIAFCLGCSADDIGPEVARNYNALWNLYRDSEEQSRKIGSLTTEQLRQGLNQACLIDRAQILGWWKVITINRQSETTFSDWIYAVSLESALQASRQEAYESGMKDGDFAFVVRRATPEEAKRLD